MSVDQEPEAETYDPGRTTRPALDVLDRDQDRLLYEGDDRRDPPIQPLADGFTSYWMALSWYQAATVRTLGHVDTVLQPSDMMPESAVMDSLLRSNDRESAYVRQRLVEGLDDACDLAYRQFRNRAQERMAGDDSDGLKRVDRENESNPLMRPAFRKLDDGQTGVLTRCWEGFDSRRELSQWMRSVTSVTNGEKPDGILHDIVRSEPMLAAFLDKQSPSAQLTRYRFAVNTLLPACLSAARTLRGSESADPETDVGDWTQG